MVYSDYSDVLGSSSAPNPASDVYTNKHGMLLAAILAVTDAPLRPCTEDALGADFGPGARGKEWLSNMMCGPVSGLQRL